MQDGALRMLDDRLRAAGLDLMMTARRLYVMEAFEKELHRVTRGRSFTIWGDIHWCLVLDSRDMLVVHLSSWIKGLTGHGGLLGVLRAHHLRKFERPTFAAVSSELKYREMAFQRLFPNARERAGAADFDALGSRVREQADGLHDDRHQNRAHFYERKKNQGSAKMMDFAELRSVVGSLEQLLNDLQLVALDATTSHHDMNISSVTDAAEDLVDRILIGSRHRDAVVRAGRERDEFYAELHKQHDGWGRDSERPFNDNCAE